MPKKGKKGRLTSSSSADEEDSVSSHAAVKGNKSGPIRCNKCQGSGHFSRDCPVKKQQRQEKAKCWVCGKQGHSRRECPGVDGESWCSKNKGKSAPPKGDEEGHRAAAAASVGSKRGKARYDDAEDQTLLEVFALTRDNSPAWIDGYTHLDMVLIKTGNVPILALTVCAISSLTTPRVLRPCLGVRREVATRCLAGV